MDKIRQWVGLCKVEVYREVEFDKSGKDCLVSYKYLTGVAVLVTVIKAEIELSIVCIESVNASNDIIVNRRIESVHMDNLEKGIL